MANLDFYLTSGFACTQGGNTFQSFVFSTSFSMGQMGLNPSQIQVKPATGPSSVGFLIMGSFTADIGKSATYVFSYFVDPPPIIHGEQVTLDPFGDVTLVTDLCITPFPCAPGNSLGTLTATTANPMAMGTFPQDQPALGVRNTLTLIGGNIGANSAGFDNVTLLTSMPEPSTILLGGSGLLGLLAFRWRAKRRKSRF
jgi:hypothetical protein